MIKKVYDDLQKVKVGDELIFRPFDEMQKFGEPFCGWVTGMRFLDRNTVFIVTETMLKFIKNYESCEVGSAKDTNGKTWSISVDMLMPKKDNGQVYLFDKAEDTNIIWAKPSNRSQVKYLLAGFTDEELRDFYNWIGENLGLGWHDVKKDSPPVNWVESYWCEFSYDETFEDTYYGVCFGFEDGTWINQDSNFVYVKRWMKLPTE